MKKKQYYIIEFDGHLWALYPKNNWTQKLAVAHLELEPIFQYPMYKKGARWVPWHSAKCWRWLQALEIQGCNYDVLSNM